MRPRPPIPTPRLRRAARRPRRARARRDRTRRGVNVRMRGATPIREQELVAVPRGHHERSNARRREQEADARRGKVDRETFELGAGQRDAQEARAHVRRPLHLDTPKARRLASDAERVGISVSAAHGEQVAIRTGKSDQLACHVNAGGCTCRAARAAALVGEIDVGQQRSPAVLGGAHDGRVDPAEHQLRASEHGERAVAADVAPGEVEEPSPGRPCTAGPGNRDRRTRRPSARRRPPTSRSTRRPVRDRPDPCVPAGRRGRCAMPRRRRRTIDRGGCGHGSGSSRPHGREPERAAEVGADEFPTAGGSKLSTRLNSNSEGAPSAAT